MVEYKKKKIVLQSGGTRNFYYKVTSNGKKKQVSKSEYLDKKGGSESDSNSKLKLESIIQSIYSLKNTLKEIDQELNKENRSNLSNLRRVLEDQIRELKIKLKDIRISTNEERNFQKIYSNMKRIVLGIPFLKIEAIRTKLEEIDGQKNNKNTLSSEIKELQDQIKIFQKNLEELKYKLKLESKLKLETIIQSIYSLKNTLKKIENIEKNKQNNKNKSNLSNLKELIGDQIRELRIKLLFIEKSTNEARNFQNIYSNMKRRVLEIPKEIEAITEKLGQIKGQITSNNPLSSEIKELQDQIEILQKELEHKSTALYEFKNLNNRLNEYSYPGF